MFDTPSIMADQHQISDSQWSQFSSHSLVQPEPPVLNVLTNGLAGTSVTMGTIGQPSSFSDMRQKMTCDLKKFNDEFKLKAVVPEDILQIIAKDDWKRREIRSKAERDSRSPGALHCCTFSTTIVDSPPSPDLPDPSDSTSAEVFRNTLHSFRKFHSSFKLKSRIPEDVLPILAKSADKQNSIREKGIIDAQAPDARLIHHHPDTSHSKASDILEGEPIKRKMSGIRRPSERSLTLNLTILEVKRLIEKGFQGPAVNDHPASFGDDIKRPMSDEQRQVNGLWQLFEFLVRIDEKSLQTIFGELRPEDLKVIADVAQIVLQDNFVPEKQRRHAVHILRKAIDCSGELPDGIIYDGDEVQRVSENPLAGGGFADVFKGSMSGDENAIAMKVPRVFDLDAQKNAKIKKECFKEVVTWLRLRHPNVLPFIGINRSLFRPRIALLSPWMKNGTSLSYLKAHPEASRIKIIYGIAKGLNYLHTIKPVVVHGDLRGSNVLIDESGCSRISDFGLVRIEDSLVSVTASSFNGRGSLRWQAPELLCPDQFPDIPCNITPKSDVYAFACLCLEIFTGYPPFPHLREISVLNEVAILDRRPARPAYCLPLGLDDEMWGMMQWCWHRYPSVRPSMQFVQSTLQRFSTGEVESVESEGSPWFANKFPVETHRRNPAASSRRTHLPDEHRIVQIRLHCSELCAKAASRREHTSMGHSAEHITS